MCCRESSALHVFRLKHTKFPLPSNCHHQLCSNRSGQEVQGPSQPLIAQRYVERDSIAIEVVLPVGEAP